MSPYQNILVPTDFSDNALTATEFAFDIAQRMRSKVVLLHVLHLPVAQVQEDAMVLIERQNELRADSYNSLNAIADTLKIRFPDVEVKTDVEQGLLIDTIVSKTESHEIDLVVMGTNGASGMKEYFVGSNTVRLIDETSVPVFAIPNEVVQKPFKKILFATDLEFDDVESLEEVAAFAKLYDAEINVIHVSSGNAFGNDDGKLDQLREYCEERIEYPNMQFHLVSQKENTLETIRKFMEEYGADMVCLSASGKNFLQRIFSGSLTHKMAYHTNIPFLAFHIKEHNKI